jgi:hypothetical protein
VSFEYLARSAEDLPRPATSESEPLDVTTSTDAERFALHWHNKVNMSARQPRYTPILRPPTELGS